MGSDYDPQKIESKWQKRWLDEKVFKARDDSGKPKYYQLETFPYPSAEGLHVGHPKGYIAEDIHARYMRMKGREVLYTMGWDAFGLPTENYAIKVGKSPAEVAAANIENFRRQVRMFGFSYDWDREINTSGPEYYKWTQWLFIRLFKKGLAYRAKAKVNWCPKDQTVLANEQAVNGKCERCGNEIEQREMEQWFFRTTDYAERLLKDLNRLDWPDATIKRQKDWIGRSEGASIKFKISGAENEIEIFTTRPDTLFGATYMVLAPEHPFVGGLLEVKNEKLKVKNSGEVREYVERAGRKTELMRQEEAKEKTGVELKGVKAVNPATEEEIPVWVADYVLMGYGAGAIMAVPAHDERDFEFAKKFALPIKEVIVPNIIDRRNPPVKGKNFVERKNVHAIVRDPKTGKYLALKWKKPDWTTFPMGGVEEGEDAVAAARREVKEETGFVNLRLVKVLEGRARAEYFAAHKDENRIAYTTAVVFDLLDGKQEEIDEKERVAHDVVWLDKSKLNYDNMTHAEVDLWNEKLNSANSAYAGNGVLVNSGKFDGMDSEEAKWEIVRWLNGVDKLNSVMVHGCPDIDEKHLSENARTYDKHWFPWLKARLEAIGIETSAPLMPEPWAPVYENWKREFEKLDIAENTVLVGHSCAASFLVRWLGESKRKIAGLILVAPAKIPAEDAYREIKDLYNFEIDESISKRVKKAFVFVSNDEERHQKSAEIFSRALEAKLIRLENRGHFTLGDMGTTEFPELLDAVISFLPRPPLSRKKTTYKLRDWSVSRQRYWGCPIPVVYCAKCALRDPSGRGIVPVPEKDLPVLLPELKNYRPKGVPPLAGSKEFMETKCPQCGGAAKRDPETLDTFVDSSWYYLAYAMQGISNFQFPISDYAKVFNHWLPVDLYVIGAEHTVLHLLYSRFITKFLHDEGWLEFAEPFLKLRHQGLILGTDGRHKMSKSKGNVVNPDPLIAEYGADTVRVYEMFMGPFEEGAPWDPKGILGANRFLARFWKFMQEAGGERQETSQGDDRKIIALLHKTIKKVGEDIENFKFNTAISALMILLNELEKSGARLPLADCHSPVKLLHPFAPHIAQELWEDLGNKSILDFEKWPEYDAKLIEEEKFTLVMQINGKMRDSAEISADIDEDGARKFALSREKVKKILGGAEPKKIVYIPKKLINIVI